MFWILKKSSLATQFIANILTKDSNRSSKSTGYDRLSSHDDDLNGNASSSFSALQFFENKTSKSGKNEYNIMPSRSQESCSTINSNENENLNFGNDGNYQVQISHHSGEAYFSESKTQQKSYNTDDSVEAYFGETKAHQQSYKAGDRVDSYYSAIKSQQQSHNLDEGLDYHPSPSFNIEPTVPEENRLSNSYNVDDAYVDRSIDRITPEYEVNGNSPIPIVTSSLSKEPALSYRRHQNHMLHIRNNHDDYFDSHNIPRVHKTTTNPNQPQETNQTPTNLKNSPNLKPKPNFKNNTNCSCNCTNENCSVLRYRNNNYNNDTNVPQRSPDSFDPNINYDDSYNGNYPTNSAIDGDDVIPDAIPIDSYDKVHHIYDFDDNYDEDDLDDDDAQCGDFVDGYYDHDAVLDDEDDDRHDDAVDDDLDGDEDEDDMITCNVCNSSFNDYDHLAEHKILRGHFGCMVCQNVYPNRELLEIHKEDENHWSEEEIYLEEECSDEEDSSLIATIPSNAEEMENLISSQDDLGS